MPIDLQSKLLRVLQEKEIERLGGTKPIKINVRILCSTNQNLEKLVQKGQFREDLYYRINVVELRIPPLRERQEDIPLLCHHFIEKTNTENGYAITGMDDNVLALLQGYSWPGSVRELEHAIQRAAVCSRAGNIMLRHMDFLSTKANRINVAEAPRDMSLRAHTGQAERDLIVQALNQCSGNKTKAAQLLGIDRTRLYHKLRKYRLL